MGGSWGVWTLSQGAGPRRQSPPQTPQKHLFLIDFGCLFGSMFKQFSFPTWIPKPTNIEQNRIPKSLPVLISFLKIFLIIFCSQFLPPDRHFSSPRCSHSTISQKSHCEVELAFCPYFGAGLVPLSLPKTNKILPKFLPKTPLNLNRFLYRF